MPGPQYRAGQRDRACGKEEGQPVGLDVPRRRRAHVEQFLDRVEAVDAAGRAAGQRGAGAAADALPLRQQEAEDLGRDPGADREIRSPKPENHQSGGKRQRHRNESGQRDGDHRIQAVEDGRREQGVAAQTDERLLADRHQAGVARQQVPVLRQREHRQHEEQILDDAARNEGRSDRQRGEKGDARHDGGGRQARAGFDTEARHQSVVRGKRPRGRTTRTIRNTAWPARICHSGLILAPTVCATPRMTPPASVPHRLPRPPMMTASKA